jgi:hypothetical protein
MEVSGQLYAPAALPPGKHPRYILDRRLDGSQSRSGHCGVEVSCPYRESNTGRPSLAGRYTDWAIPAPIIIIIIIIMCKVVPVLN